MQDTIVATSPTDQTDQPSETIVRMIADREGISPTDLSPPLYSAIDPEALDSLFDGRTSQEPQPAGSICFRYCGYEIAVERDGDITIADFDE